MHRPCIGRHVQVDSYQALVFDLAAPSCTSNSRPQRSTLRTRQRREQLIAVYRAAASAVGYRATADPAERVVILRKWLEVEHGISRDDLKLQLSAGLYSSSEDFRTSEAVTAGEVRALAGNTQ